VLELVHLNRRFGDKLAVTWETSRCRPSSQAAILSGSHSLGVRWYVTNPISYRQLEKRGAEVNHSMLNRRVIKYVPLPEQGFFSASDLSGVY
jgi:hypothetical protein